MKRAVSAIVLCAAMSTVGIGAMASSALAAQPVIKGCVGSTFSQGAHNARPLGQLVKQFAEAPDGKPGLGDGIAALSQGLVDDGVVPNTCNDAAG